jgi:hypothetical protein
VRRLLLAAALLLLAIAALRSIAWDAPRASTPAPGPPRGRAAETAPVFELRDVEAAIEAEPAIALEPAPARTEVEVHPKPSAEPGSKSAATLEVLVTYLGAADPAAVTRVSVSRLVQLKPLPRIQQADHEGRVAFEVEAGIALLLGVHAASGDRSPLEVSVEPLTPGERRTLTIDVPALGFLTFVGRVLDGRSPIVGAEVRMGEPAALLWTDGAALEKLAPLPPCVARSDAQGYFAVQAADFGLRALRVDAPGFVWTLAPFIEGHRTRELAREVILERAASLAIELGPLPDTEADAVRVALQTWGDWFDLPDDFRTSLDRRPLTWSAVPSAAGLVLFAGLPPGELLTLELDGIDYQRLLEHPSVRLDPGESRTIDLRRGMGGTLEGTLRDPEGRPHERAELWLAPREGENDFPREFHDFEASRARATETDGAGRFRFDDVPDGDWWVGPSPRTDCLAPREPVSLLHGRADRALELVATGGMYIEGRVVSWRSNPVTSGGVHARLQGHWKTAFAELDKAGAFRLGPLYPGRYSLLVKPGRLDPDGSGDSDPVEVDAGARDLVVICPLGARLIARADPSFGASGESLHYLLTRIGERGEHDIVSPRREAPEGVISCGSLPGSRYNLYAWTSQGRFAIVRGIELEPGVTLPEIPLVLSAGGVVRVHCRNMGSRGAFVSVTHSNVLVGKGSPRETRTFEFNVPPGRVHVELRWWEHGVGSVLTRDVDISAGGEPVDVVFDDTE